MYCKSNIKDIKILNLWVVRQFRGEYNPIHYHEGDLSGVGYLKLPKNMTRNIHVKNKKIKTISEKIVMIAFLLFCATFSLPRSETNARPRYVTELLQTEI